MTYEVLKRTARMGAIVLALLVSPAVSAHCDALDGPVVADARTALDKGDPAAALRWVKPEYEAQVRDTFRRTLAVRTKGRDARELSERWFFETLVRLHRAGEGEAFTGLKPAGSTEPGLAAADAALKSGTVSELVTDVGAAISEGIARRHALALERRAHAGDSVAAGRAYVEAYVDYAHFVEAAHRLGAQGAEHGHHAPEADHAD